MPACLHGQPGQCPTGQRARLRPLYPPLQTPFNPFAGGPKRLVGNGSPSSGPSCPSPSNTGRTVSLSAAASLLASMSGSEGKPEDSAELAASWRSCSGSRPPGSSLPPGLCWIKPQTANWCCWGAAASVRLGAGCEGRTRQLLARRSAMLCCMILGVADCRLLHAQTALNGWIVTLVCHSTVPCRPRLPRLAKACGRKRRARQHRGSRRGSRRGSCQWESNPRWRDTLHPSGPQIDEFRWAAAAFEVS